MRSLELRRREAELRSEEHLSLSVTMKSFLLCRLDLGLESHYRLGTETVDLVRVRAACCRDGRRSLTLELHGGFSREGEFGLPAGEVTPDIGGALRFEHDVWSFAFEAGLDEDREWRITGGRKL